METSAEPWDRTRARGGVRFSVFHFVFSSFQFLFSIFDFPVSIFDFRISALPHEGLRGAFGSLD
jgi:hypothetical protein